jgi:hypothetical protein
MMGYTPWSIWERRSRKSHGRRDDPAQRDGHTNQAADITCGHACLGDWLRGERLESRAKLFHTYFGFLSALAL